MPRTINVAEHAVRMEAFLDAAQSLIQTKGYEAMSIQDVLDAVDSSRGAFYHYFDSKHELLEGVVDRLADVGMASVAPILADPDLTAVQKLERVFAGIARLKAEQKDLVLAIMDAWMSDGNALVREKLRHITAKRIGPVLSTVIKQGVDDGLFNIGSPDGTELVLLTLIQGFQVLAGEMFVARQAGTMTYESVRRTFAAYTEAFERILGVAPGSITLSDEATLRFWFD
ncbi:MAG TPA: TetR/AcrR family transcriptional regulator [Patescibacteria group bacterium]|nr:TetR/AcrR family transcriptional regulator [Patescibacteria group bacterium]